MFSRGARSAKSPFGSTTPPPATNRSFQPSLLKSTIPFDQPVFASVGPDEPDGARPVLEAHRADVAEERHRLAVERRLEDVDAAVVVEVAGVGAHARDLLAALRVRDAGGEGDLLEPLPAEVVEEERGLVVVRDEHVRPAVVVEVGDAEAHALADVRADAGGRRHVGEGAVAVVAEERVRQALVAVRVAVVGRLRPVAHGLRRRVPHAVVGDEQVEVAVLVVVEEGGGHRPQRPVVGVALREAGAPGHVLERAVAAVAVEQVLAQAGDEEVGVPVVVVVARGRAELVALPRDPGA